MKNEFKSSRKIFNKIRLPKVKHKKIIWLGLAFLLIFGIFTPITALAADKTSGFTSFDPLILSIHSPLLYSPVLNSNFYFSFSYVS